MTRFSRASAKQFNRNSDAYGAIFDYAFTRCEKCIGQFASFNYGSRNSKTKIILGRFMGGQSKQKQPVLNFVQKVSRFGATLIVIAAALFYGLLLLLHTDDTSIENNKGHALVDAVQLAFGQKDLFPRYHHYASLMTPKVDANCSVHSPIAPNECVLLSQDAVFPKHYYANCQWWRFQRNCTQVTANALLLSDSKMRQAFDAVLANPCDFTPTADEVNQAVRELKQRAENRGETFGRLVELRQYDINRGQLHCDEPRTGTLKIVVNFGMGGVDQTTFIALGRIGHE